jgi:hypothetical protein
MLLLCTRKFTQTSIDIDKKKCQSERQQYCLAHSPEKCSPVFGPNLRFSVIGSYAGSELYAMESEDSRQVGRRIYSYGT